MLPQAREFNHPGVLFMSDGTFEQEMDRWFQATSVVMQPLGLTIMVKKEQSRKTKLLVY